MSPDLNNTSVQCVVVPAQTCVDLRPELDPAGLMVFDGFVQAITKTGFRSLLITHMQYPSVQRAICTLHVRAQTNTYIMTIYTQTKPHRGANASTHTHKHILTSLGAHMASFPARTHFNKENTIFHELTV